MLPPARAKKRFGQHFLTDIGIINGISAAFGVPKSSHIIEIGPGTGALTKPLLAAGLRVTAIEFDRDMVARLEKSFHDNNQFSVLQQDILKTQLNDLDLQVPVHIIGNLPYNISSAILFHLLAQIGDIASMYFMLQKEVVDRICAGPGGRNYGRPSVMIQRLCEVESDIIIPPQAFEPPPKVVSAMLRLRPRSEPVGGVVDEAIFGRLVSRAFSQRRKTLRNTLAGMVDTTQLAQVGIDSGWRAEVVSVEQFVHLANLLSEPA
jgi:16S rRNA (adenine1518-N6/adenine1519-N6)-dimethyltransferase